MHLSGEHSSFDSIVSCRWWIVKVCDEVIPFDTLRGSIIDELVQ